MCSNRSGSKSYSCKLDHLLWLRWIWRHNLYEKKEKEKKSYFKMLLVVQINKHLPWVQIPKKAKKNIYNMIFFLNYNFYFIIHLFTGFFVFIYLFSCWVHSGSVNSWETFIFFGIYFSTYIFIFCSWLPLTLYLPLLIFFLNWFIPLTVIDQTHFIYF